MRACLAQCVAHSLCSVDSRWLTLTLAQACVVVYLSSYWLACWEKTLLCSEVFRRPAGRWWVTQLLCESLRCFSVLISVFRALTRSRRDHFPEDLAGGMGPYVAQERGMCSDQHCLGNPFWLWIQRKSFQASCHTPNPAHTYAFLAPYAYLPHIWANTRPRTWHLMHIAVQPFDKMRCVSPSEA